jgi:soluble cytochrome b562
LADYIKEIRNETPANLGNQEARSKAMAERVNAADEAKRTANMRMAEFFAAWGSSPGNTITAGLNALKNKIPDMIGDAKEATKIRREIDKDIAAIDKIDREEELGTIKDARAAKEKVAERAETRYGHKLTAYVSLENSKRQAETSKYVADVGYKSAVDSARIRSSNSGGGGGNTYKTDNQAYNQAVRSKQNEEKLFDKSLESTPYGGYKAYLNNPENQKKDPKKWAAAENYVKQKNEERRQLLAPYDEDINYYKGRLGRDVPTQNAPQVPMYATNGKDRIVSNDGGKTWQPVGGK